MHGRRFRLGLFTLGAGALFVALLGFILHNSLDRDRATYFILFRDNVKGMVIGSRVNFQGVPIGVVSDMRFQDGKTLVELRVDPSRASIQDVTRARMDRLLVTGQVTVELEGYGPAGKALPPGAMIEPKVDPLHSLTASLPEVVNQASGVLRRLDAVLAGAERLLDDQNQQRLTAILAHTETAAQRLADDFVPAATATLADARRALRSADSTAAAFSETARAVEAGVASLVRLEHDARALLQESQGVVAGMRGPALATFAGMRSTLDDLRGLLRQLKLAPDSLLFGVRQPAAPAGGER